MQWNIRIVLVISLMIKLIIQFRSNYFDDMHEKILDHYSYRNWLQLDDE